MKDTYKTIAKYSEGFYKEKGSKFMAFAFPVTSEKEIKRHIDLLKKKYYDARHHCYAWVLGNSGERYRANDDGEPSHSAGDPILGQIRSKELTDTLIVVVRYFGGTKLGVSGLINAYKTAAAEALANNTIEERLIMRELKIRFEYPVLNRVMKLIRNHGLEIIDQQMEYACAMTLGVRRSMENEVKSILKETRGIELEEQE